jgi:uncharacterized protein YbjT (DUF2867 family)
MSRTIRISGATGALGRALLEALAARGYRAPAPSHRPYPQASGESLEAVTLSYDDRGSCEADLTGIDGLFLVAPMDPLAPARVMPLIRMAQLAAVGHIVYVSAFGADRNGHSPCAIERALIDSAVPCTILRPSLYMETFSAGFIAPMIHRFGRICLAAGEARAAFVSMRDVAAAAAAAFIERRCGKVYRLTGPQALDHAQAARAISEAAGRDVEYRAVTEAAMLQIARENGMAEGAAQYVAALYAAVRAGEAEAVTSDVETVTGRRPVAFQEFAKRNADDWLERPGRTQPAAPLRNA